MTHVLDDSCFLVDKVTDSYITVIHKANKSIFTLIISALSALNTDFITEIKKEDIIISNNKTKSDLFDFDSGGLYRINYHYSLRQKPRERAYSVIDQKLIQTIQDLLIF